jgi:predicted PurR-regulated permease PerM
MSPRFPIFSSSSSDARTAALQGLLIASIVIAGLYFGREVLLPLALAILLSFVLSPALLFLRRLKVPRLIGVGMVVAVAFVVIFALGWLMSQQATQLAGDLPRYQYVLAEKISALRNSAAGSPALEKATEAVKGLQRELANPKPEPKVGIEPSPPEQAEEGRKPIPVEIHEQPPQPFELFRRIAGTVLPPLATAGIVILFVIFILLQREELRDRAIRLLGASDMQRATSAMNDAAERLSKYFLSQFLLNSAYGFLIALGLWLIGVPSPIVWGILAMLMRFVPYVGSFIAAAPPLLLAAVVEPGWTTFLLTFALYLLSELTMGQVIEPLVYGHGTGVSPIAVIISTVFWTWLWGPLGLLLAMPLTVCLVVLGRHVEGLNFLEVLLGDKPAFTPQQSFFQRALTGDSAEATYQAELALNDEPLASYLDDVALKGLQLAERDLERGSLDEENLKRINTTVKEMMENLSDFEPRRWFRKVEEPAEKKEDAEEAQSGLASLSTSEEDEEPLPILGPADLAPGWEEKDSVLCIGGRTPLDEAAAAMLAGLLKKHGLKARAAESEAVSAGNLVSLDAAKAKLVCLSFLGIGSSPAQVRYLMRRLRRILPSGCKILVGCWTDDAAGAPIRALKETAEADAYVTSFHEAAEICVNAARRTALELVTPLQRGAGTHEMSNLVVSSTRDVPLKIVAQPPDDSPVPAKNRKNRTGRGVGLGPKHTRRETTGSGDRT